MSSLKASPHPNRWTDMLYLALLGIRTIVIEDLKCTSAELVNCTSLLLPGGFFAQQESTVVDPASYATRLKDCVQTLHCTPSRRPSHSTRHSSKALESASHVFVHHDAVKKPLQQPYDGPFPVLTRSDYSYTLDLNGCIDSISVDRLKPAYVDFPTGDLPPPTSTTSATPPSSPATMSARPSQSV